MTVDEAKRVMEEADLLAGEEEIHSAIHRMAREITERLAEANPVVLCVMNGGLIFAGQILPRLRFPLELEYVHATRYGQATRGSELNWIRRPGLELSGRSVLLLDDILDEGITLASIADSCREAGAREVQTAVLVEKLHRRKVTPGMRADFTGLETGDRYLFGYGLDYKGYWRNAPGIFAVRGM